jgi:type II secretory pathway pseudopilin PulG
MDTWVWIVIAAVAILVLVVALTVRRNTGARRLGKKRAEAGGLRQEAQQHMGTAGRREAAAKQEVEGARREREAAEDALRRADDVDPDVPEVDR